MGARLDPSWMDAAGIVRSTLAPAHRAIAPVARLLSRHGRWLWPLLLVLLAGFFLLRQRDQIARIGRVLAGADPKWVLGAIAIQLGVLWLTALTYQALLGRLGHRLAWLPLASLHLRRVAVGTVVPVGGPPSLYVLVRGLDRRGVPAEDALLAAALRSAVGYVSFLLLLGPALLLHHPSGAVLAGAAVAVAIFVAVFGVLRAILHGSERARRWPRWVPARARGFVERAGSHGVRAGDLLQPLGLALAIRVAGVAMLYVSLRAVGENPSPLTPLVAYAVGILCLTVAPVFQGIGVVEVAVSIALERLGVSGTSALGAALLCRLGELWLPLALGLVVQVAAVARAWGAGTASTAPLLKHIRPACRPDPRRAMVAFALDSVPLASRRGDGDRR